jgi:hypothetical protein
MQGKVRARSTNFSFLPTFGGLTVDIDTDFLNIFWQNGLFWAAI